MNVKTILLILILLGRTVSVGYNSLCIRMLASCVHAGITLFQIQNSRAESAECITGNVILAKQFTLASAAHSAHFLCYILCPNQVRTWHDIQLAGVQQLAFSEYRRLFITPSPLTILRPKPAQAARGSIFHLALLSYSPSSLLGTNPLTHHLPSPLLPPSNYAITQISSLLPWLQYIR